MGAESRVVRGAIIGGVVAVMIHITLRFALRHWRPLLAFWALAMINQQCSSGSGGSARSDVLASFERDEIVLAGVVGLPYQEGKPGIAHVAATVTNGASATIYDIRLVCRYQSRGRDGSSLIWSEYHIGEIQPGSSERIKVAVNGSGLLQSAIPDSLQCEPMFEFVRSDLLRARGRAELDVAALIDIDIAVEARAEPYGHRTIWASGLIDNASEMRFARADVECRVRTHSHGPSVTIRNAIYLRVNPGKRGAFRVRIGEVAVDRKAQGHHCRIIGVEAVTP
jgi:hypothetical protein